MFEAGHFKISGLLVPDAETRGAEHAFIQYTHCL